MYGKDKDGIGRAVLTETDGRIITSGSLKQSTLNENMFFANAMLMEVALYTATAAIGLQIYNPPTSGVNLVWSKWASSISVTSANLDGLVLAVGDQPTTPTGTTAAHLTGGTLLKGSTSAHLKDSAAFAYSISTIIAPVFVWPLITNTAAINTVGTYMEQGDFNGQFASVPGTCTVIGGLVAAGVDIHLAVAWEEVPV